MFLDRIPDTPSLFEAGRPVHIEGGPEAVLILHGWTGWPGRLASVATALAAAGFTVDLPRLPGHGTSMHDMLQTGARDWIRRAVDAYMDLRVRHETVHVMGTSMGAIMTIIVAAKYNVPKIALLAPALLTQNPFIPLSPFMKLIVKRIPTNWNPDEEPNPLSREIGMEYATKTHIATVAQLYRMQRWGRKAIRRLESDMLVIASEKDRSVPIRVVDYIREKRAGGSMEELILHESSHQLGDHVEKERVAQAVVDWFTGRL
jgi:carboxylesterase